MKLFKSFLALGLCVSGFSIQATPLELQNQFIDLMVNEHQFDRKAASDCSMAFHMFDTHPLLGVGLR